MRKTRVEPAVQRQIVALRERSKTWLDIEKKTGVDRRVAKRVFEQWQQEGSKQELKRARRELAGDMMREHMREVMTLASVLVRVCSEPDFAERRASSDVIDEAMCLQVDGVWWDADVEMMRDDKRRVERRNRLLLTALREHTSPGCDWDVFDQWLRAWDRWVGARAALEVAVERSFRHRLQEIGSEASDWLLGEDSCIGRLVDGLTEALACAASIGRIDDPSRFMRFSDRDDGISVYFDVRSLSTIVRSELAGVNLVVERACLDVALTVPRSEPCLVETLRSAWHEARGAHDAMADMLDELRLGPILINTRCAICPL